MTEWISVGGFWVSIFMAIIAVLSVLTSLYLFREASAPDVVVSVQDDRRRPGILTLVIENIGRSPAWDVSFQPAEPLPKDAWGLGDDSPEPQRMDEGPLVDGIPFLAPGARRVITWGQWGGLTKAIGQRTIDVQVSFRARRRLLGSGRRRILASSRVEIASLAATDSSDSNWDKHIAKELEKLNKSVEYLARRVGDER